MNALNIRNVSEIKHYYDSNEYVNDAESYARTHRKERLSLISKYVDYENLRNVLEVGCGSGVHKNDFNNYVGVDISITALEKAKPANLVLASADNLPFKNCSFELVISFNLIEHLYNPERFLDESLRVCKRQGFVVISSPHLLKRKLISNLFNNFLMYLKMRVLKEKYRLNILFKQPDYTKIGGDADAVYLTDLQDIMLYFKSRNCKIINEKRHKFLFFLTRTTEGLIIAKK
ncbi:MAG: class I SAM-dependent methyltransferase [Nitrososphaerales archaeon]